MKEIAILLGVLLFSIIVTGIRFKFYAFILGEGGLLGPADHSLSHEIKNLVKLRDEGLIDAQRYEEMKEELIRRRNEICRSADNEIQKLEKLQKQGVITPEEFEDLKHRLNGANQ